MREPLTDSELAVIQQHIDRYWSSSWPNNDELIDQMASEDVPRLLADLQALRAAVAALLGGPKLAAAYADEPVYSDDGDLRCVFCNAYVAEGDAHKSACSWAALRALLPPVEAP